MTDHRPQGHHLANQEDATALDQTHQATGNLHSARVRSPNRHGVTTSLCQTVSASLPRQRSNGFTSWRKLTKMARIAAIVFATDPHAIDFVLSAGDK